MEVDLSTMLTIEEIYATTRPVAGPQAGPAKIKPRQEEKKAFS
jgi:hypothetical protein